MKRFRFISVLAAMVSVSLIAAPGTSAAKKTGAVAAKRYHAVPFADNERQVLAPIPDNGDNGRQVLAPNPDGQ